MKRRAVALTLILALFSVTFGVQVVKVAGVPVDEAGEAFSLASPISIISPSNSTYSSNLLTLNVTFKLFLDPSCANISYSVDGKNNATIPVATAVPVAGLTTYVNGTTSTTVTFFPYTITGWVALPELPEGPHNITVYAKYQANNVIGLDNSTVYFTINDGTPPIISNLSIENKTYNTPNIPLNFKVDESTTWLGYSLDQGANVTITGNMTLTGLSDGTHSLTVYANDTAGNTGTSETIYFSIKTFPITWIVAAIAIIAIGGVAITLGVVFYRRKRLTSSKTPIPNNAHARRELSELPHE